MVSRRESSLARGEDSWSRPGETPPLGYLVQAAQAMWEGVELLREQRLSRSHARSRWPPTAGEDPSFEGSGDQFSSARDCNADPDWACSAGGAAVSSAHVAPGRTAGL